MQKRIDFEELKYDIISQVMIASEVWAAMGCSPTAGEQRIRRGTAFPDFPQPFVIGGIRLWLRAEVEAYLRAKATVVPVRRVHQAEPGECPTCDREREAKNTFHPSHDASRNCESGKHKHCSCDTCF